MAIARLALLAAAAAAGTGAHAHVFAPAATRSPLLALRSPRPPASAAAARAPQPAARASAAVGAREASAAPRARGGGALRTLLRASLVGVVLSLRVARVAAGLVWLWLPASLYWLLPVVERAAAAGDTPLAAAMRGSEALEQLVDMACTTVYLPVVGILYAILIGVTIEALWARQAHLAEQLTADCARAAMLLPALDAALGAEPVRHATSVRLLRAHMLALLDMFGPDPAAAAARAAAVGDAAPAGADASELLQLHELLGRAAAPAGRANAADALGAARAEVRELVLHACARASALRARLPPVHWATLTGLAFSLAYAFWIVATGPGPGATAAAALNCGSPRIRLLFSGLVGAMSFAAKMIADLETPLSGQYRIREVEVASLPLLRRAIADADIELAELERAGR
ncbi:hypothetical protein KFE25_009754 [Diacronema lutheri]|uniref:Uncharacterized protein n=1 Tax=Diacronema lutheri TaxID=2081491 RepID=A0A8J6C0T7_DIALT|nr:hypothetical protein KFE25_009754 [Diacronema lutheri]